MKIIDAPPPASAWKKRCTCPGCSTTVEVNASDVKAFDSPDSRENSCAVFLCPTCRRRVWIDSSQIPDHVWMTLAKSDGSGR